MLPVVFILGLAILADAAPRSRNKGPQLVFDQQQKGDYNIQVHLKNFQVIALLGEDSPGLFGDYDYNYDYGDFTVKPSGSSTTGKPSADISIATTVGPSGATESSTQGIEKSTEAVVAPEAVVDENIKPSNSEKPLGLLGESKPDDEKQSLETIPENSKNSTIKEDLAATTQKSSASEAINKDQHHSKPVAADGIPGQIQVQILQSPDEYPNFAVRKNTANEDVGIDSPGKSNEKRCSSGFMKDKKGRCRRLRRPQSSIPFDFGRLAHLAARFRSATSDGSSKNSMKLSATGSEKH